MEEFMIEEEVRDLADMINIPRNNIVWVVRNAYLDDSYPRMNVSNEEEVRGKKLAGKLKKGLHKL